MHVGTIAECFQCMPGFGAAELLVEDLSLHKLDSK
jgi:hypothetical protein